MWSVRSLLTALGCAIVIGAAGCHAIFPFDRPPGTDAVGPGDDLARLDGGAGPGDLVGEATTDAPLDAASADLSWPDAAPPDAGRRWDLGGTVCKTLALSAKPVQVSAASDTLSGSEPSIAAIGDTFYIAFIEGGGVYVREIDATAPPTAATAPKFSAKLSATPASAPFITRRGTANKLGLVWHEKTTTSLCSSNSYFREVALGGTNITAGSSCWLDQPYPGHGYGPASLVYDGTQYTFVSPVEYQGTACGAHAKFKRHAFTACTAFSGAYQAAPDGTIDVFFPSIVATGKATNPLLILWLHNPSPTTTPNQRLVRAAVSTSPSAWTVYSLSEQAAPDRPTLVATGAGAWFAWTTTAYQTRLAYRDTTDSLTTSTLPGYARHISLAHKAQVGQDPSSAVTVLAFSETTAGGGDSTSAVGLTVLDAASLKAPATYSVASASSVGASVSWSPRQTVVAAGANGFGVAWTEQIKAGQSEVFFRWVGCQP